MASLLCQDTRILDISYTRNSADYWWKGDFLKKTANLLTDSARNTIEKVFNPYEKTDVKMKSYYKCKEEVMKLHDEMKSLV